MVESVHTGHVVVVDHAGDVIHSWGNPDAVFFQRSAAKPFQAAVSQRNGADLTPRQLAVAASSHSGEPVHVSIVSEMLAEAGLDEGHLLCPPDRAMGAAASRRDQRRAPILHNCSGKHAAMLRACVASNWPLDYTRVDHPLQVENFEYIAEVSGVDPGPVGVDGCGIPTLRTTTLGLARSFGRLATDPGLTDVAAAMHQYPFLTAGTDRPEPDLGVALNAAVKGGAKGCLGVAVLDQFGIGSKASDGSMEPAAIGAIEAIARLGLITPSVDDALSRHRHPVVRGGGRPVGRYEAGLE